MTTMTFQLFNCLKLLRVGLLTSVWVGARRIVAYTKELSFRASRVSACHGERGAEDR